MRPLKLYTSSVVILSLASLVENLAYALPISYFPEYVQVLGASVAYIGLFTAAFTAANASLSQRFGSLSDRVGRKRLIQAGLLTDVVLGTLTGLIWNWAPLLIIRLLNGVATAAVAAPAEASLVDQVPREKRGEALGFYLTMSMVGFNLGPVFGGVIQFVSSDILGFGLEWSYRIPFFIDSVLAFIAFLLVYWGVEETRGKDVPAQSTKNDREVKLSGKMSFSLKILYISSLATGFAVGFIIPISVLYFGDVFSASSLQIGIILSISGFVGLSCNLYAGKISDRIGRKPIIALGALPSRLATIALPFAPDLTSAAGITVFRAFGHNVAMPAARALNADIVPEKVRGKLFGRLAAFFSLGAILGPVLSTLIYDTYRFSTFNVSWLGNLAIRGVGIPFLISSAIGLFSLLLLLVFVEEPRRARSRKAA
ncbi:MAG: MFS transporter [Candidatus Bathyarchaeota archaeon]|jgi:MFS family permease|nr:MAG: MFS transporter [Candidatus Bathyarchaeota archaeon]